MTIMTMWPINPPVEKVQTVLLNLLCSGLIVLGVGVFSHPGSASAEIPSTRSTRTVTDAVGRVVVVPTTVVRVGTIGPVPVLDSLILALGKGDTIVSGLPTFAQSARYKYLRTFLPQTVRQPPIQTGAGAPNIEMLLALRPDVIVVMDRGIVEQLARYGVPVVTVLWREPDDIKRSMRLLGEIFNAQPQADAYLSYVEATMARVDAEVADIPEKHRTRVLYCSPGAMSQPHLIADWWIGKAGGISVTAGPRFGESFAFSMEQVFKWNPQVILVPTPRDVEEIYRDQRWSTIEAVRSRRIYTVPIGAHSWGNRTAEQPLTVLWAAKTLYPDRFADLDVPVEAQEFYRKFFGVTLSHQDMIEILSGIP